MASNDSPASSAFLISARIGCGRDERVERQRRPLARLEVHPDAPGRAPVVDDLVGHPGGERLVEPQVVPPGHRHQVAEPLVRQLVGDHLRDPLLHRQRRGGGIGQQRHLAEGDGARVLHRARLEVGDADLIELAERVGEAEVVLEPRQDGRGRLLSERREVTFLGGGPGADRDVADADDGARHDRPDDEGDEVRRKRRRRREGDPPAAAPVALVAGGDAVRERDRVGRNARHGDPPDRLESRLVEAGEDAARVGCLELRDSQRAGPIKPAQTGAEGPCVGERQLRGAGRQRLAKGERDGLAGRVDRGGRPEASPVPELRDRRGDVQTDRVQRDLASHRRALQRDLQRPFETPRHHIDAQISVVAFGFDLRREAKIFSERRHAVLG